MEFFSSINLQEENPTFPTEIKDFPWNSLNNSGTPRNLLQIPQNFRNSLEISENTSRILRNLLEIPQNSQKSLRNPLTSSKSLKNLQKSLEPPFSDLPRPSPTSRCGTPRVTPCQGLAGRGGDGGPGGARDALEQKHCGARLLPSLWSNAEGSPPPRSGNWMGYGYGSIPIDTLVGWTSINPSYELGWTEGTRVLTHPHMEV